MKIIIKLFYIIVLVFFTSLNSYSDDKIKFIDLDSLLEKSTIGKKIINNLNDTNNNNLKLLKPKEKKIIKDKNEINKQKNIISNEELKIKIDEYQKEVLIFQNEKKQLIENFNKKKQKQINDFFNQVTPIINEYMEKNDISIIFDKKNIFIAKSDSNITSEIINLINERLK
jgi:Skp family chaperone for outer membrane proteins